MNWVIKLNSINIHTSSVAPPWSNIWPITWWTADICVFLFLSSNATATASLFSVGWFITHAKVSSKRGAYSWQSLMILLKDNDSRFFGEMLRSTDLFFTWQRVLHWSSSSFRTHLCNPGFKDSMEYNFLEILGPLSPLTIDFTTDCHTPSLIIRVRTLWSCLPLNDT